MARTLRNQPCVECCCSCPTLYFSGILDAAGACTCGTRLNESVPISAVSGAQKLSICANTPFYNVCGMSSVDFDTTYTGGQWIATITMQLHDGNIVWSGPITGEPESMGGGSDEIPYVSHTTILCDPSLSVVTIGCNSDSACQHTFNCYNCQPGFLCSDVPEEMLVEISGMTSYCSPWNGTFVLSKCTGGCFSTIATCSYVYDWEVGGVPKKISLYASYSDSKYKIRVVLGSGGCGGCNCVIIPGFACGIVAYEKLTEDITGMNIPIDSTTLNEVVVLFSDGVSGWCDYTAATIKVSAV